MSDAGYNEPLSPSHAHAASSKLQDVGRTVTAEAATHLRRLKESERTKEAIDTATAWASTALEDPSNLRDAASKMWQEHEKVTEWKEKGKGWVDSTLQDEEKMERVRRASAIDRASCVCFLPFDLSTPPPRLLLDRSRPVR
jgi:hypothetical protein